MPYHTAMRWLSCGRVKFRFFKLRNEIDIFLTERDGSDPQLLDPTWQSKFSFLIDITSHMNDLNLKLRGKDNFACDLYIIIKGESCHCLKHNWKGKAFLIFTVSKNFEL